jgi:hypothetical protein
VVNTEPEWGGGSISNQSAPEKPESEEPAVEPQIFTERGDVSMSTLAAMLTAREQFNYLRLTGLTADVARGKNVAAYVDANKSLNALTICSKNNYGVGKKLMGVTALIYGTPTEISIYRLPDTE